MCTIVNLDIHFLLCITLINYLLYSITLIAQSDGCITLYLYSLDGTFKDDVCNCIVLEMLPLLDNAITTLFSSSPSVYNQSNSSSRFVTTNQIPLCLIFYIFLTD